MNITFHGKFSYEQDKIIMIISWYPLYLLLIIIFNTILISSLSPCSIELHDLTISISGNKISSAISMFPWTLPLLSVFFQLCLCCLQKLMFFCFHQHLDDFIPFLEDTTFKRMHLLSSTSVFLLLILPSSLLSGDEWFMSVLYQIILSLVRLFCQTIV